MYKQDTGEQRAKKLKDMCNINLNIKNNHQYGWELSTALADRDNKKALASLTFNVNDDEGFIDIYIFANKKDMYNKYTSLEKNGIGELECMISQTLDSTIAHASEILIKSEFDTEEYYQISIYVIPPSTYDNVLKLLNTCLDILPKFYKKNRI